MNDGPFEQYFGVLLDGAMKFNDKESLFCWLDEFTNLTGAQKGMIHEHWVILKRQQQ